MFGASLSHFGLILSHHGALLSQFGSSSEPAWAILEHLGPSGSHLATSKPSWRILGSKLEQKMQNWDACEQKGKGL